MFHFIDWGDDTPNGEWIGPYASGEVVYGKHTFEKKGTYLIKAQAKDVIGTESAWGYLEVTMPKSSVFIPNLFLQKLFERFPHAFPLLRMLLGY